MKFEDIKTSLIEILEEIQITSGYDCPVISANTKPLENLLGFDSVICPVAIVMLEKKLDITIPIDVNIFYKDKALSINETVEFVMQLVEVQNDGKKRGSNE